MNLPLQHDPPVAAHVAELSRRRGGLPLLAELDRLGGRGDWAVLARRLGQRPGSVAITAAFLMELGWVEGGAREDGLRLTAAGRTLAAGCRKQLGRIRSLGLEGPLLRRWTLAITALLAPGPRRFGQLRRGLPGVTPRALVLALDELERCDLVTRRVEGDRPPAVYYQLRDAAGPLRAGWAAFGAGL